MNIEFAETEELDNFITDKLHNFGISENEILNPCEIIIKEGIMLYKEPFSDPNIRGALLCDKRNAIVINSNRTYQSQRFIAMHELSHFWRHPHDIPRLCMENGVVDVEAYTKEYKRAEWQANHMAAFALMNPNLVTNMYYNYDGKIDLMSKILLVSPESLIYRVIELGIENRSIETLMAAFAA